MPSFVSGLKVEKKNEKKKELKDPVMFCCHPARGNQSVYAIVQAYRVIFATQKILFLNDKKEKNLIGKQCALNKRSLQALSSYGSIRALFETSRNVTVNQEWPAPENAIGLPFFNFFHVLILFLKEENCKTFQYSNSFISSTFLFFKKIHQKESNIGLFILWS